MPPSRTRQLELPLPFGRGTEVSHARIAFDANLVTYAVRRSRRRRGSFSLAIDERGLRIAVPWNASAHWIEEVLRRHQAWIVKKLAEWQSRRAPPPCWCDGGIFMLLGAPLRLAFAPGSAVPAHDNGRLLINVPADSGATVIAQAVTRWLRGQASACFRERIALYAPRLRVAARDMRLSEARTRWGSCHPSGKLLLNWRLVQMPLRLVDYVVVHELAHLREMNHSPRFWRIVAEVIPDYAARRKAIHNEGRRYLIV